MFLRHGHNLLLLQQPQGDGLPYETYGTAFNRKPMFNIYRLTYAQEPLEQADYVGDALTGIPATPELVSLFTGIRTFLSFG